MHISAEYHCHSCNYHNSNSVLCLESSLQIVCQTTLMNHDENNWMEKPSRLFRNDIIAIIRVAKCSHVLQNGTIIWRTDIFIGFVFRDFCFQLSSNCTPEQTFPSHILFFMLLGIQCLDTDHCADDCRTTRKHLKCNANVWKCGVCFWLCSILLVSIQQSISTFISEQIRNILVRTFTNAASGSLSKSYVCNLVIQRRIIHA